MRDGKIILAVEGGVGSPLFPCLHLLVLDLPACVCCLCSFLLVFVASPPLSVQSVTSYLFHLIKWLPHIILSPVCNDNNIFLTRICNSFVFTVAVLPCNCNYSVILCILLSYIVDDELNLYGKAAQ